MLNNVLISLVGKNEIAREGLRKILSSENFHIRNSVADITALGSISEDADGDCDAHVIVVDNGHNDEGIEACRLLGSSKADARLVLLTDQYRFEEVALAFQIGVDAVIIKEISCGPLIESISLVAMGEKVFPSQLANDLTHCVPATPSGDWRSSATAAGLSAREVEILESIMAGMANKVIARRFDICEATVKVHVKAILRKLGVENRTQAATWAVKHSVGGSMPPATIDLNAAPNYVGQVASFGQAA